jgi:hypothetical protein
MSIDKNSTGLPEVNLQHKTTQVNLWMVVGIVLFLAGAAAVAYVTWRQSATPVSAGLHTAERPQR